MIWLARGMLRISRLWRSRTLLQTWCRSIPGLLAILHNQKHKLCLQLCFDFLCYSVCGWFFSSEQSLGNSSESTQLILTFYIQLLEIVGNKGERETCFVCLLHYTWRLMVLKKCGCLILFHWLQRGQITFCQWENISEHCFL